METNLDLAQELESNNLAADLGMKSITNGVRSLMLAIRKKVHVQKKKPASPQQQQ